MPSWGEKQGKKQRKTTRREATDGQKLARAYSSRPQNLRAHLSYSFIWHGRCKIPGCNLTFKALVGCVAITQEWSFFLSLSKVRLRYAQSSFPRAVMTLPVVEDSSLVPCQEEVMDANDVLSLGGTSEELAPASMVPWLMLATLLLMPLRLPFTAHLLKFTTHLLLF